MEKDFPGVLVIIGVHSPKFPHEKETAAIRKAVLRYEIAHPVVNDADHKIWKAYGVEWWPTIAIIDPEGNIVSGSAGEPRVNFAGIDKVVAGLIAKHKKNKTLDETPVRFDTALDLREKTTITFTPDAFGLAREPVGAR